METRQKEFGPTGSNSKMFLVNIDLDQNQIVNVAPPTQSGDVATFEWVTGLISDEKSERETADSKIDGKIADIISNTDITAIDSFTEVVDTINSEIEAEKLRAMKAEKQLDGGLKDEKDRAQSAEGQLEDLLHAKVNAINDSIDVEAADRMAADSQLQSNIDSVQNELTADVATLQSNIDNEQARAEAAEAGLASDLSTETADRISAVSTEEAARIAGDLRLSRELAYKKNF